MGGFKEFGVEGRAASERSRNPLLVASIRHHPTHKNRKSNSPPPPFFGGAIGQKYPLCLEPTSPFEVGEQRW